MDGWEGILLMQNYNIPRHRRGDTWLGIPEISINIGTEPLNLDGAVIRMQVRRNPDAKDIIMEWSTEDNTIEILNNEEGKFRVNGRVIDILAGKYYYDIEINTLTTLPLPDNRRIITVLGGSWEIIRDVTR